MSMALGGIIPNVSTDFTALLGRSAFEISKNKPDPIEKLQPKELDQFKAETDSINISSKAIELSQTTVSNTLLRQ